MFRYKNNGTHNSTLYILKNTNTYLKNQKPKYIQTTYNISGVKLKPKSIENLSTNIY